MSALRTDQPLEVDRLRISDEPVKGAGPAWRAMGHPEFTKLKREGPRVTIEKTRGTGGRPSTLAGTELPRHDPHRVDTELHTDVDEGSQRGLHIAGMKWIELVGGQTERTGKGKTRVNGRVRSALKRGLEKSAEGRRRGWTI